MLINIFYLRHTKWISNGESVTQISGCSVNILVQFFKM